MIIVRSKACFTNKEAKQALYCCAFEKKVGNHKMYGYVVKHRPIVEEDYDSAVVSMSSLPLALGNLKDSLAWDWGVDRKLSSARLSIIP